MLSYAFYERAILGGLMVTGSRASSFMLQFIRDYFGEKIGLFFTFLHFYDSWLSGLAALGVAFATYQYVTGVTDSPILPLYAIATAIWAPLFLEYWKRKVCSRRIAV